MSAYWHKDIQKTAANVRYWGKADIGCQCPLLSLSEDRPSMFRIWSRAGRACHFFIVVVIRYETTAAAPWALLLIVRTFFNDAVAVADWKSFHACLPVNAFAGALD
jgi:hypothetical protein